MYSYHNKLKTVVFRNTWLRPTARSAAGKRRATLSCAARAPCGRAVELAGLLVEGGSLLDGAEAGDAEGLTGLGDGLGPAADVLVRATAGGVLLLGGGLPLVRPHYHETTPVGALRRPLESNSETTDSSEQLHHS